MEPTDPVLQAAAGVGEDGCRYIEAIRREDPASSSAAADER
jgi:hypothetical protein